MGTHRTLAGSRHRVLALAAALVGLAACSDSTAAPTSAIAPENGRTTLPSFEELKDACEAVQDEDNGGLGFDMWCTVVDREGVVQAVAFTGATAFDQWPASRAISPVDEEVAYAGPTQRYGTEQDPMVGKKIGGINVFGGGLALYGADGTLLGALGVSGDFSCADHIIAWKVRDRLELDFVPAGVSPPPAYDNIIFDLTSVSPSGFGHPECNATTEQIAEDLPTTHPISGGDDAA